MNRVLILVFLFAFVAIAGTCRAQDSAAMKAAMKACGAPDTEFNVELQAPPSPPNAISSGNATIYFVSDFLFVLNAPTVRIGVDGNWIGALRATSYTRLEISSGTHHFCAQGQGRQLSPDWVSLYALDAKAGQSYFFLVDTDAVIRFQPIMLSLAEINSDEGRLLVAKARLAVSSPKRLKPHP